MARTKAIVTTVGPYAKYGNGLIHCCVEQNTDYCDITGEIHWVRFNINRYQEAAMKSGARLIFSAGCDSTPWDLATYLVNEKVEEGDQLAKIDHQNEMQGAFSGGTLSTVLNMIDGRYSCPILPRPKYDVLKQVVDSESNLVKAQNKFVIDNPLMIKRSPQKKWLGISVFAGGNSRIVSRSHALNNYSDKLIYSESFRYDSLLNCVMTLIGLVVLVTVILLKPLRNLLLKYKVLPSPGEGATAEQMRTHFAIINTEGTTVKGKKIRLCTSFNDDIGYRDTARMLAEAGLCFVFDDDKVKQEGGLYTPASCLGMAYKDRLEASGTEFKFC